MGAILLVTDKEELLKETVSSIPIHDLNVFGWHVSYVQYGEKAKVPQSFIDFMKRIGDPNISYGKYSCFSYAEHASGSDWAYRDIVKYIHYKR